MRKRSKTRKTASVSPKVEKPAGRLAHYDLIEKIGAGGMSEVWRALDTRLGREVAVKLLSPAVAHEAGRLALLRSEARAVAALNHPNIIAIHAIEDADGRTFLVMELARGRTLKTLIPKDGLPLESFLAIAIPLAGAVSAAHESGVIHGDLKPSNLMVSDGGDLKILDFGLARFRHRTAPPPADDDTTRTQDHGGALSGTLHYMAPELLRGRSADARSDVFSLGVVLYEMVSGRPPFSGETVPEIMAAILKDDPPRLDEIKPEIPRHLGRIIGRSLEKDPGRRIRTARDLRSELEAIRRNFGRHDGEDASSIAVLPFSDLSPEKNQDYFCEGVSEDILNTLSRLPNLRVAARASSFRFKDAALDCREIGDRLGVSALLSGSVRKAGPRLRITAELTDVSSGFRIWSERYDRELADVFAIQDEIAGAIVDALAPALAFEAKTSLGNFGTADVRAYDFYLRGRSYFLQHRRRGFEYALQMFERAAALDPGFAQAYAGTADCRSYMYLNFERSDAHRREADVASLRALELAPHLAEAHVSRGLALSLGNRHAEAGAEFEEAVRLNPCLFEAHYFYARDLFIQDRLEDALQRYETASRVRPDDYQSPLLSGQIYADLSRAREAEEARRRGVRLVEERLDIQPDDVRALYMGANGLVALGEREKGLAWATRALEIEPGEPMLLYNLACIYSLADKADRALDCLERAINGGFSFRLWLEKDSNLDSIRDLSRFQDILRRLA